MADEPVKVVPPLVTEEQAAALIKDLVDQVSTIQPFMLVEAFRLLGVEHVTGQFTPRELIVDALGRTPDGTSIRAKVVILPISHTWDGTTLRDATVAEMGTSFPTPNRTPAYQEPPQAEGIVWSPPKDPEV